MIRQSTTALGGETEALGPLIVKLGRKEEEEDRHEHLKGYRTEGVFS